MTELVRKDRSDIKKNNMRLCLATIINNEPLSRPEICKMTQISKPTVSHLVDELVAQNIVVETDEPPPDLKEAKPGRKPSWLSLNKELMYYIAFELGRTHFSVVLSDLKGRFIQIEKGNFKRNEKNRRQIVYSTIKKLLNNQGIGFDKIYKAVCISAGVYTSPLNGIEFWETLEKCDLTEPFFIERPELKVEMVHSTKMALLGEKTAGEAKDYENAIYLDFAYGGVGAALLINGRLHRGIKNAAGEIGYSYSSIEEFKNYVVDSNKSGELENKIRGESLERRAAIIVESNPDSRLFELSNGKTEKIDGKMIFRAAAEGDPLAYSLLRETFSYLNMALSNAINLLAPEIVILGGGYSSAGETLLSVISSEIQKKILVPPRIVVSRLKDKAELIGGIQYLIENTDLITELYENRE